MVQRPLNTVTVVKRLTVTAANSLTVVHYPDILVAADVAVAEVLGQVEQHLAAQHLVAVHVGDVLNLGLHCWKRGECLQSSLL